MRYIARQARVLVNFCNSAETPPCGASCQPDAGI